MKLLDLTNQQDFQASERCQLGARSKHFTPVYPPREHVIAYFHHWVDQALATQDES
ncbi:SRPBCC family protein [Streptomyces sp. NPDC039022]|uniref:SRPBCC family protein n=1 Tax=Streptomyces sp. NPDC039022 TaxID=3157091 RepID=UPI0033D15B35